MSKLKIISGTTVHCKFSWQANYLLNTLHSLGYEWTDGKDLRITAYWEENCGDGIYYEIGSDMKVRCSGHRWGIDHSIEYEEIVEQETKMNIFGMNLEFGANKDDNLCSTVMGVAVKSNGTWRIYDAENHKVKDVGNIKLGNFPVFLVPATSVSEGDLIKQDGEYYYVSLADDAGITTVSAATGKIETFVAVDNLFGINIYTKVVAIGKDFLIGESGKLNIKKLLLLNSMMKDGTQQSEQNILPLLLLSDDGAEGKTDDKLLKMIALSSCGSHQNNILPLILLEDKIKL